ncbi:hypothetical protein [Rhizobium sp. Leaf321]|uniref:hypothetical protein n=1 Tax=Rhizobium sp. Leaf321 TaxID=1736335 RepID=UPI000AE0C95B|nr:hypothetical protein [Rhizobium sp. Leaf321]
MIKLKLWYYSDPRGSGRRPTRRPLIVEVREGWTHWTRQYLHQAIDNAIAAAGFERDFCHVAVGDTRARHQKVLIVYRMYDRRHEPVSYPIDHPAVTSRLRGQLELARKAAREGAAA